MLYPDLASTTSATIRADLMTASLAITPATEAYLAALEARTRCWKGIFAATAAWLTTASAEEQAVAWQSIVKMCNRDGRPLVALSRLYHFKNDQNALKTLWQALPSGTLPELQVYMAANPLLRSSGVTGIPPVLADASTAAATWTKVQAKMEKLSQFENPGSP